VDLAREVVELKAIAAMYRKRGRLKLAADVLRTALSIQRNQYGSANPETALTLYQIGEIHTELELYDIAREYYKEAVDTWNEARPNSAENALYFNEAMMQLQSDSDREEANTSEAESESVQDNQRRSA
jgi:tetratricopeptide (TPR) repeat protein